MSKKILMLVEDSEPENPYPQYYDDPEIYPGLGETSLYKAHAHGVAAQKVLGKPVDIKGLAEYIRVSLPTYPMPEDYEQAIIKYTEGK